MSPGTESIFEDIVYTYFFTFRFDYYRILERNIEILQKKYTLNVIVQISAHVRAS